MIFSHIQKQPQINAPAFGVEIEVSKKATEASSSEDAIGSHDVDTPLWQPEQNLAWDLGVQRCMPHCVEEIWIEPIDTLSDTPSSERRDCVQIAANAWGNFSHPAYQPFNFAGR
jgi:hypothetical protein